MESDGIRRPETGLGDTELGPEVSVRSPTPTNLFTREDAKGPLASVPYPL